MKHIYLIIIILISFTRIYSQWLPLNSGTVQNLNSISFINSTTGFAAGANGTIIKTSNGGTNWQSLTSGTSSELKSIFAVNANIVYACGMGGVILKSTNSGINWFSQNSGTTNNLWSIYFRDSAGIACGNGTIIYTSNGGTNWLTGQDGFLVSYYTAFMLNKNYGWVAGVNTIFSPLVGRTTNGGANWNFSSFLISNNEGTARDIYFHDSLNGIIVSNTWDGQGGVSRTTNGGANWTSHQLLADALFGIDFTNQMTGYAVGFDGFIVHTTDAGNSWTPQVSGSSAFLKSIDMTDSMTGYIAGDGGVILKTTNGGLTAVKSVSSEIPEKFTLEQNYPNPFNPYTIIRFQCTIFSNVMLIVYDVTGREIEFLVNESLQPGIYELQFDGSRYPSGVYYYTLIAGEFRETKKLVLVK